MPYVAALFFFPGCGGRSGSVWVDVGEGVGLAAVVAAFVGWFPSDGSEGALEEGVVNYVALVIFALDDPVAGIGFTLP
jgi:hypothetical protein